MSKIPKIKGLPLVGVTFEFQKDPLKFLQKNSALHPDLFEFQVGANRMYFTNNSEYIHQILHKNFKNYDKKNIMYKEMSILFGQATSVVDGNKWKEGYQLIQPSLTMKRVIPMINIMDESIKKLIALWEEESAKGDVDVSKTLLDTTLDVIVNVMFGSELSANQDVITESFRVILNIIVDRIVSIAPVPTIIPTPQNLKYQKAINNIDKLLYEIIEKKLKNSKTAQNENEFQDMLSQWIEALKASNKIEGAERRLRDEVIGIFVAGHGSSATFLSWIFYHLANNQEVQEKLFNEFDSILGKRKVEFQDFEKLKYAKAVINEAMRITPPGWIVSRSNIEEEQVGPYKLPPNSMVLLSPYLVHHNPLYWENSQRFDPERFYGVNEDQVSQMYGKCRFIPFTAGPRVCTGKNMAEVEAMLFVTQIVQKFKLDTVANQDQTLIGGFNLVFKDGIKLKLTKRI